jgi:hypothetical protein
MAIRLLSPTPLEWGERWHVMFVFEESQWILAYACSLSIDSDGLRLLTMTKVNVFTSLSSELSSPIANATQPDD